MSYKILTKNGVENTNIEHARDFNFNSGGRSGIIKGVLNECNITSGASNVVTIDTCELRLCGHRIVIEDAEYLTLSNNPSQAIRYSIIAEIRVADSVPSFKLFYQLTNSTLIKDNLSAHLLGNGTYQLELGRFTLNTDGTISDIVRTADLIVGGGYSIEGGKFNIGNITTNTLDAGMEAEIDVEERYDAEQDKIYTDFTFNVPKGDEGKQGIQGPQGVSGTIKSVEVVTLPPTSNATIENKGTAENAELLIGIPRGATGSSSVVKTATEWETENPVLEVGQVGYDRTNSVTKIGDGQTAWNDLNCFMTKKPFKVTTFQDTDWESIAETIAQGTATQYFKVGDEKTITLTTGEEVTLVIIAFHHDIPTGGGLATMTLCSKYLLSTMYPVTTRLSSNLGDNSGGWDKCKMRESTMNTIYGQLPLALQKIILSVDKKASAGNKSSTIVTSSDKLWLFSEVEVTGTTSTPYKNEGTQYEYFKDTSNRIKYLNDGTTSAKDWWTRSPYISDTEGFREITYSGDASWNYCGSSGYVCFGFCL